MSWKELPFRRHGEDIPNEVPRPAQFEEIIEMSRVLSAPFPHARIDFMVSDEAVKLSEITFYTGSGFHPWTPREWEEKLGRFFRLEDFASRGVGGRED